MEVYLLYIEYGYEGQRDGPEVLEGIYSTIEKARAAKALISPWHSSHIVAEVVQ